LTREILLYISVYKQVLLGGHHMLNRRNCQNIAETANRIIGYSILLTDNDGIVLGSSEKDRVGTLHEASLDVIRSGCQVFHNEQQARALQGTRPGTTIPIVINDEVVGTIGITGEPDEISKYGTLIKKLAEVFLKDQLELESARLLDQSRQNLLREILTFDPNTAEERVVLNHGRVLGYDLLLPRAAVMVEVAYSSGTDQKDGNGSILGSYNDVMFQHKDFSIVKQVFNHEQDLCVDLGNNRYLAFAYLVPENRNYDHSDWLTWLTAKCNTLVSQFARSELSAWIGIGSRSETLQGLRDSYNDAYQALDILKCKSEAGIQYINDVFLERLILSIPDQMCKRVFEDTIDTLSSLKNGEDFIDMVVSWCENRFNFSQTARSLNVHKNTLMYRFSKFKEITGFDLYDFKNIIAIYLIIMRYKRLSHRQNQLP
jgi:carbohydrate diacid regulator